MKERKGINLSKLRGLLAEHNLTQNDYAKLLNVSNTAIQNKLSGKAPFKDSEVHITIDYFKINADFLFNLNVS